MGISLIYLLKRIYYHLIMRFKPLTVHTEAIFLDEVWEEIKKKTLSNKVFKWYVMTPTNYLLFRSFLNLKLSKKELSDVMKERYKWLLKHNQKLELHVHLSKLMNMDYNEQKKLIEGSIKWFIKNLGYKPCEIVTGWYAYNKDTLKILKKHRIKLIKEYDYYATHDYTFIKK